MKIKSCLILLSVIFLVFMGPTAAVQCWATTYYISSSEGSDANNGTSESTPWQHLDMVVEKCYTAQKFQPGDNILLKRGDVFAGQLQLHYTSGTPDAPIFVGAYGSGDKPIIYGDSRFYQWHPVSDLGVAGHSDCYYADIGYKGNITKSYSGTEWITRISTKNPVTAVTYNIFDSAQIDAYLDMYYQSWWDINYNPLHPTSPKTLTADVCGPEGAYPGRVFARTANGLPPVYVLPGGQSAPPLGGIEGFKVHHL